METRRPGPRAGTRSSAEGSAEVAGSRVSECESASSTHYRVQQTVVSAHCPGRQLLLFEFEQRCSEPRNSVACTASLTHQTDARR